MIMTPVKQICLVGLFVVALILGVPGTAPAAKYRLHPAPGAPIEAGGVVWAEYEGPYSEPKGGKYWIYTVRYEVWGLAPDTDYRFVPELAYFTIWFRTDNSGAAMESMFGTIYKDRFQGFSVYDGKGRILLKSK
jgi:hypothetical protein